MTVEPSNERELWGTVDEMLGDSHKLLGRHWSYNLHADPKRLAFVLSRYKFAAKMASRGRSVLELGCSEGIGAPILAESATAYTGVDLDAEAIAAAKRNWTDAKFTFVHADFLDARLERHDTIVSLDVVEHIQPEFEHVFFEAISSHLAPEGVAVVGTPNATAAAYASKPSQEGHVNLFGADRLRDAMSNLFRIVLMFGINDEVVHTGYAPMAHYLVAVGCFARSEAGP